MPTRDTAWPNGTPCWVDYGAADLPQAREFYTALFGWTHTGGEPEYGGYLTCLADGRQVAGMAPQQDPDDPPRWTVYIATDDAAATAARVTAAGGSLVAPPMDVGPMGTMAIAHDPEGRPFGIWQAGEHTGKQRFDEPGTPVWHESAVEHLAAAKAFYGEVFGYTFTELEGMDGYSTFATGEEPLGGIGGLVPGAPAGWAVCFGVVSTDETVALVEARGGKVTLAAEDTPFGRFAVVEDPWGAGFSVMQEPPS